MTESGSSSVASTSTQPATPQFIQSSIPLPSKLDFKGNLAVNWKKFKRLWTNYEIASRLSTQSSNLRTATLLTCIGPDILEIYDGLPFGNEEEKTDIDKVIELLDAFSSVRRMKYTKPICSIREYKRSVSHLMFSLQLYVR